MGAFSVVFSWLLPYFEYWFLPLFVVWAARKIAHIEANKAREAARNSRSGLQFGLAPASPEPESPEFAPIELSSEPVAQMNFDENTNQFYNTQSSVSPQRRDRIGANRSVSYNSLALSSRKQGKREDDPWTTTGSVRSQRLAKSTPQSTPKHTPTSTARRGIIEAAEEPMELDELNRLYNQKRGTKRTNEGESASKITRRKVSSKAPPPVTPNIIRVPKRAAESEIDPEENKRARPAHLDKPSSKRDLDEVDSSDEDTIFESGTRNPDSDVEEEEDTAPIIPKTTDKRTPKKRRAAYKRRSSEDEDIMDGTLEHELSLKKKPAAKHFLQSVRNPGDDWISITGEHFKITKHGQQIRLCEVRELRKRYKMPNDSRHPDKNQEIEVVVEKWLTDEEYTKALKEHRLAWQDPLPMPGAGIQTKPENNKKRPHHSFAAHLEEFRNPAARLAATQEDPSHKSKKSRRKHMDIKFGLDDDEIEFLEQEQQKKEEERLAQEEAEQKAKEEAEQRARLEAERLAKLAEAKAKEDAEKKVKEEEAKKIKQEAANKAKQKEEAEKKAKAEAEVKAKETTASSTATPTTLTTPSTTMFGKPQQTPTPTTTSVFGASSFGSTSTSQPKPTTASPFGNLGLSSTTPGKPSASLGNASASQPKSPGKSSPFGNSVFASAGAEKAESPFASASTSQPKSPTTNSPFGKPAPAPTTTEHASSFGSFGATSTVSTEKSSPFGAVKLTPTVPSNETKSSPFGAGFASFGAPTSSPFSVSNAGTFGSTSGAFTFGSTPQTSTTPTVEKTTTSATTSKSSTPTFNFTGSSTGSTIPAFGSQPTSTGKTTAFGSTTSAFGTTTTNDSSQSSFSFGAPKVEGSAKPTFTFGTFGSSQDSKKTESTTAESKPSPSVFGASTSIFGASNASGGSAFGSFGVKSGDDKK